MVSKTFANFHKFGKYYRWPAQDCLNWSDHCNLLFLHESMLQINHWTSTWWLNVCAKMRITSHVQNTGESGWKSSSFFLPRKSFFLPKELVFFLIILLWEKITKKFQCCNILRLVGYLLSKDQENTLDCFRDFTNIEFLFFLTPFDYTVNVNGASFLWKTTLLDLFIWNSSSQSIIL